MTADRNEAVAQTLEELPDGFSLIEIDLMPGSHGIDRTSQLRGFHSLRTLKVNGNRFDEKRLIDILLQSQQLAVLNIAQTGCSSKSLPTISQLLQLKYLTLATNRRIVDTHFEELSQLDLEVLNVDDTSISDKALKNCKVWEFDSLRDLMVRGTFVTGRGWIGKLHSDSIEGLYLSNTGISDEEILKLRSLNGLKVVWLSDTDITDRALAHLSSYPKLENLDLMNTQVTPKGLICLADHPSIKSIRISDRILRKDVIRRFGNHVKFVTEKQTH